MSGCQRVKHMTGKENLYQRIFSTVMVFAGIFLFLFPETFQESSSLMSVDEKIDLKIRYSAIPIAIGIFCLIIVRFSGESTAYKLLLALLTLDFGYFVTRLIALAVYDFESEIQFVWLIIEIIIASVLLYGLKLKKAPSKA